MKRDMLTWIFLFGTIVCMGQKIEHLDTIYANDTKNVALFFPEPIRQGITGSDNFVFTYNREKQQYFGLLQATPSEESNLLVINRDGTIFSYIVKYTKQLSKLNYFIPKSDSVGNEKPIDIALTSKENLGIEVINPNQYYRQFCSYLIKRNQRIGRIKKRNEGIVLSVEDIVFDREELYFVIEIKNTSTLDYDLNFLKLSIEARQRGKRKSLQRLYKKSLLEYNLPSKIREGETAKLVYVLPKFALSDERRAILELNERNGERNIKLRVSHTHINNPN